MLIPLPNITYNVEESKEYYESLKQDHMDLMWSKNEIQEYLTPTGMMISKDRENNLDAQHSQFLTAVGHKEPFISWTREQCLDVSNRKFRELTEKVCIWNIKYDDLGNTHPKLDRQAELQYGFAKKILDIFTDLNVFELIVNPVGTKYHKHTDDEEDFRIIIPIISDEGAVWHFDNASNVTQFPGHAYMLLREHAHATDVLGPSERVSIHFLLNKKYKDWVLNLKVNL